MGHGVELRPIADEDIAEVCQFLHTNLRSVEPDAEGVSALIRGLVDDRRPPTTAPVADDQDLLADGALDSLAFVGLLVELSEAAGVPIDFLSAEPEDLTTLDGLTELVLPEIRRPRA